MPTDLSAGGFPDENKWPFLGRSREFDRCLGFLKPDDATSQSRMLRISGESGAGKSFFVKELICRFTERAPSTIGLYINVEESEFESAELEKRLALLASYPAEPTRSDPQHVPVKADLAQYRRPIPRWLQYTYSGVRESTGEIPILGRLIRAFLPQVLPVSKRRELVAAGRFWEYLIATARRDPVLLVLDNFQFLPASVAIELDSVLAIADVGFRLAVIDRLSEGHSAAWNLRCFGDNRLSVELPTLSQAETQNLVLAILGEDTPKLDEIGDVIFRKSGGNPKQIWLQLRAFQIGRVPQSTVGQSWATRPKQPGQPVDSVLGNYEETIQSLPPLDRMALQLVTLLMGGLKVDDLVGILRWIVHPFSEDDIRKTILDLALIGLVVVNGSHNNRVRTEHELVSRTIRRITTEEQALELREDVVSALSHRLDRAPDDEEYERLVDRLVGLMSAEDLHHRHDLLAHLIALIDKQHSRERFHYLTSLFGTQCCSGGVDLLPPHCLETFLDAFQKTSQFDKGLAAVELMRGRAKLSVRNLNLYAAKYLVQKFQYGKAELLLRELDPGSDRDVILFNILLNLCREGEAKQMVEALPHSPHDLDEFQSVMLRNASHLYDENSARELLVRAKDSFRRLGLKFGEATTLNNLGVLELWAGRYSEARRFLAEAHLILQGLDSNEAYQPLTNLAILDAMEGDLVSARRRLERARTTVSPWLKMDDTMLLFNQLVLDLMEGNLSGSEATAKAIEFYNQSLQTKDLRFQDVLAWFTNQLESIFTAGNSAPIPNAFETRIRNSSCSGLEIFSEAHVDGQTISTVFVLSPHWRY